MQERQAKHEQLIAAHQARLRGFMRCRVRDDAVADDLAQETWVEVLRHIDTFDEAKGTFWAFVLIWAKLLVKRFRSVPPFIGSGEREALGADPRARDPEAALIQARLITELLRRAFACSRPPHEVVTFGFSKLNWKPSEIVEELCESRLGALAQRLESEYTALVPSPAVRQAFPVLHERLALPLGQLVRDPRVRRSYAGLLDRVTGETKLREYLPADHAPEEAIVWWWGFVKRAVLIELHAAGKGDLFELVNAGAAG